MRDANHLWNPCSADHFSTVVLNEYLTPSPEGIKFVLEFLADKQPALKAKNPNDFIDHRFVRKLEEEGFFKKVSTR